VLALRANQIVDHVTIFPFGNWQKMIKRIHAWACAGFVISISALSLIGVLLLIRALSCILWSQEAAGWVQAVGSIAAIFVAGQIASWQVKKQFEDARTLEQLSRLTSEMRMLEGLEQIIDFANRRVLRVVRAFEWDRDTFCSIASGERHFDRNILLEVQSETAAIALHEVPNARVIAALINHRSCLRQLHDQLERGLQSYRNLDATRFAQLFNMLDDGHKKLCMAEVEITEALIKLRTSQ